MAFDIENTGWICKNIEKKTYIKFPFFRALVSVHRLCYSGLTAGHRKLSPEIKNNCKIKIDKKTVKILHCSH